MPTTEEERRRKIIIDSQVIRRAARVISMAANDELTSDQLTKLVECDKAYLSMTDKIVPELNDFHRDRI